MDELIKEFLSETHDGIDRMERCLTELEAHPASMERVGEVFRVVHTMKGSTGFLGFNRLEKLAHNAEHLLGALRDQGLTATPDLITGLLQFADSVRAILKLIEQGGGEGNRKSDEEEDEQLIQVLTSLCGGLILPVKHAQQERVDGLRTQADNTRADAQIAGFETGKKPALITVPGPADELPTDSSEERGPLSATTLRVDVDILNRMMDLVGELVLTRNQMLQGRLEPAKLPELSRRLDSVTSDLRETVMQARMQPVAFLFGRFTRVARDLARSCGRRVRVEFSGQDTGLDKSVLEALKDPLTHAVRNAIDHGIEPPAERLLAGKAIEGLVRLKASHQSGSVVIEISDDGAGISRETVVRRAILQGLVTAAAAVSLSDREVLQFIFRPGFSTAKELTHISGRGVGMDVVRANVESVGGSVELDSIQGFGTTLRLRVPLTLAIIPALILRSAGEIFALPQSSLVELVYVSAEERSRVVERMGDAELFCLRENLLPIVWLDRTLALPSGIHESGEGFYLAVVEADGCRYGLAVDDLLAPEEIVVKPLSKVLRQMRLFSGATVLGDGSLALILDVAAIATRAKVRPVTAKPNLCLPISDGKMRDGMDYLIFEERADERGALPLASVERIETIALAEIEYVGGHPLIQYRGVMLRLIDRAGLLKDRKQSDAHDMVRYTVLILRETTEEPLSRTGLLVRRVLDVGATQAVGGHKVDQGTRLVVLKEKITLVDEDLSRKHQNRMEVA